MDTRLTPPTAFLTPNSPPSPPYFSPAISFTYSSAAATLLQQQSTSGSVPVSPLATPASPAPATTLFASAAEPIVLSPRCEALLTALVTARPSSAISVWQPRPDVTQRGSSRVKKYNKAFLDLCDAVDVKPNQPKSAIVPLSPHFLSEETARVVGASMERSLRMITAIHRGFLDRGADVIIHVSRLGRQKTTIFEVLPVRNDLGEMTEYIAIHTLVDPEVYRPGENLLIPLHLQSDFTTLAGAPAAATLTVTVPAPAAGEEHKDAADIDEHDHDGYSSTHADDSEQCPLREVREGPYTWVLTHTSPPKPPAEPPKLLWEKTDFVEPQRKRRIHKSKKRAAMALAIEAMGPFQCSFCGVKETSQRRRGPNGPQTLCNACGIRWAANRADSPPSPKTS